MRRAEPWRARRGSRVTPRKRRKGIADPVKLGIAAGLIGAAFVASAVAVQALSNGAQGPEGVPPSARSSEAAPPAANAAAERAAEAAGPRVEADATPAPPAPLPRVDARGGPLLQLSRVEVLGLRRLAAREVARLTGVHAGQPLLEVDPASVRRAVAAHPRIAECRAARLPPDTLLVHVRERVPLAVLAGKAEGIDASGNRLALLEGEAEALPELEGNPEPALPLLRAARRAGVEIATVAVRGPEDVVFEPRGWSLHVRSGADPERALRAWRVLSGSERLSASGAGEIDLRFRGRAIVRGPELLKD